jgi:hypothetical protein
MIPPFGAKRNIPICCFCGFFVCFDALFAIRFWMTTETDGWMIPPLVGGYGKDLFWAITKRVLVCAVVLTLHSYDKTMVEVEGRTEKKSFEQYQIYDRLRTTLIPRN